MESGEMWFSVTVSTGVCLHSYIMFGVFIYVYIILYTTHTTPQQIKHNITYISDDYVHFTSSFLLELLRETTIDDQGGIFCDIFDLLTLLYSQKVLEKDENCKELCCKIIDAFGIEFYEEYDNKFYDENDANYERVLLSADHTRLLTLFLDFVYKYDLLKNNTDDLARNFYSYNKYRYNYGIINDIIQILPANDKLTYRFAMFIMDFTEQCKLVNVALYNDSNNIKLTNECLQYYLKNTNATRKQQVKSFLLSYNCSNSKEWCLIECI